MADFRKAFKNAPKNPNPSRSVRPKDGARHLRIQAFLDKAGRPVGREYRLLDGIWSEADGSLWRDTPQRKPEPNDVVPRQPIPLPQLLKSKTYIKWDRRWLRSHKRGAQNLCNTDCGPYSARKRMRLPDPLPRPNGRGANYKGKSETRALDARFWRYHLDADYRANRQTNNRKARERAKKAKARRLEAMGFTPEAIEAARKAKREFRY